MKEALQLWGTQVTGPPAKTTVQSQRCTEPEERPNQDILLWQNLTKQSSSDCDGQEDDLYLCVTEWNDGEENEYYVLIIYGISASVKTTVISEWGSEKEVYVTHSLKRDLHKWQQDSSLVLGYLWRPFLHAGLGL